MSLIQRSVAKGTRLRSVRLCLLLMAACSDDPAKPAADAGAGAAGSGDAVSPPAQVGADARFLVQYASAVCAMYEPCCNEAERGYDASGCSEWFRKVTAAYFRGEFQADAAQRCLDELAAAREADARRCATVKSFDEATLRPACRRAFTAPAREGNPLGGDCLLAADCMSAPGGDVICFSGTCVLEKRGAQGDGPCRLGRGSGIEGVPDEIVRCDARDGLYCDEAMNACAPQVEPGEACPFGNACTQGALCNGGRCDELPEQGELCLNYVRGAGGFCAAQSACDAATGVCGPPLLVGAACREANQCESASCMGGKCTEPEFTRALNCTGK
jgi:hypothetical protein